MSLLSFISCRPQDISVLDSEKNPASMDVQDTSSGVLPAEPGLENKEGLSLFDHTAIKLMPAGVLDLEIKNCNIYQDIYGDLILLGELLNKSEIIKTNIEITLSFFDKNKNIIDEKIIPAYAEYLRSGKTMPFVFVYEHKTKYINLSEIKIGVNYKNYNKGLEGYPVVTEEDFYYDGDVLTISGNIFNLGASNIENLRLLCTFYNKKNQVVFIRDCFIQNESLGMLKKQDFKLSVLLDEYIEEFTDYRLEVFFRDSLKT
ncbi:MAG: hypothetical protein JW997_07190 [Actinobacteria bacterium]|nr:hypothetical protein [Actinomycetota bacterium]